jgi:serine/threonine/tyrosine-interacting protein
MMDEPLSLVPSFDNIDSTQLTETDVTIITQNKTQISSDSHVTWKYESRRQAQPVLDFLYLGPWSVAKDADFLTREGITMVLVARDSRMAEARLFNLTRVAQSLSLAVEHIDVTGYQGLIRAFPVAVKAINDHLLAVYRSQAVDVDALGGSGSSMAGQIAIDQSTFRRGKVLVCCETGNDRSAAIVAAYIMTVFNLNLIRTLQFVGLQRFCVTFDEEMKQWLRSYDDILIARRMVSRSAAEIRGQPAGKEPPKQSSKRRIEATMDTDDTRMVSWTGNGVALDMDRYTDRPAFTPFGEQDTTMTS